MCVQAKDAMQEYAPVAVSCRCAMEHRPWLRLCLQARQKLQAHALDQFQPKHDNILSLILYIECSKILYQCITMKYCINVYTILMLYH